MSVRRPDHRRPGSAGDDPTGGATIIPTDMPMGGGTIECDVFAQDCKGADEKCTAWAEGGGGAWNATKCVKETGKKIAGDVCTTEGGGVSGMDDCAKGNMCWNVNDKNEGICVALCKGDAKAPICPAEFQCAIANEGVLNLCLPECDPLLQDCDGTDLCIPSGDKFICVLDASGDNGKQNDPCMFANACDKGLICLNTTAASTDCMKAATGCCSPFCDFAKQDTICPKGTECVQWFDPMMPIPPGLEDVGVCAIPA
ncbi:MAG: ribulose phosphate epimerase [Nannocystis sp.]|uniref:ribulose phosphate epimerase n=1 Tax=Nannocystis sp. TaxID=1962667 RepID=UPI002422BEBD|nr:ribulose phosphate epimerase [Nannocystis sp.]MBK9755296.1 ribulose phosphate epimerase [Nannocystis sp.]